MVKYHSEKSFLVECNVTLQRFVISTHLFRKWIFAKGPQLGTMIVNPDIVQLSGELKHKLLWHVNLIGISIHYIETSFWRNNDVITASCVR